MRVARVAVDTPLFTLFDYLAGELDDTAIGRLVRVPFGKRSRLGVVFELSDSSSVDVARLKAITEVIDAVPPLTRDVLALLAFSADYYQYPIGAATLGSLPPLLREGSPRARPEWYRLCGTLPPRLGKVQQRIVDYLSAHGVSAEHALRTLAPTAAKALQALLDRGVIARSDAPPVEIDRARTSSDVPLTTAQQAALAAIGGEPRRPVLLFGVTGSGKTEIYLQLVAQALARGEQALILAPEINLTPQLDARFRERFPNAEIVFAHSGMAAAQRREQWIAAAQGRADVVIGTRLAVFTPMPRLGLIVIDEEHDASFKQQDRFRYSARDAAVFRARHANVTIVLGSATPSLESYANAKRGRYTLLRLNERAHAAAQSPRIELIDTRAYIPAEGLSLPLRTALAENLAHGRQSLVFINRRGYAPVLWCRACTWAPTCTRCDSHLIWHKAQQRLCCHHCGQLRSVPAQCPDCGAPDLAALGEGTQRIEEALASALPGARIRRVDTDSMRARNGWNRLERAMHKGEVDVLVGTQMLAKGHDFPNLSLVGVLNSDGALLSADFRAGERLFALLLQVAGRAGRRETQGRALIQTAFPGHPLFAALAAQDYAGYAETLLEQRRQAGFPPYCHQALLRAEAATLAPAIALLEEFAAFLRALELPLSVFDSVPARLARLAGRERAQLLVQAVQRAPLHEALTRLREKFATGSRTVRWSIDVDPQDF